MITAKQLKAARALIGMKQSELAEKTGVSVAALNNFERGVHSNLQSAKLLVITAAMHQAGVTFMDNDQELGVTITRLHHEIPFR